jgi:hypothetical protein
MIVVDSVAALVLLAAETIQSEGAQGTDGGPMRLRLANSLWAEVTHRLQTAPFVATKHESTVAHDWGAAAAENHGIRLGARIFHDELVAVLHEVGVSTREIP